VLCCAVLCCAVLCCAVLCCAVLCCAVLCCAVLRRSIALVAAPGHLPDPWLTALFGMGAVVSQQQQHSSNSSSVYCCNCIVTLQLIPLGECVVHRVTMHKLRADSA